MSFTSTAFEAVISRAKFNKDRTEIPNNHKCFQLPALDGEYERLLRMALALGIDLDKTEYSYVVVKKKDTENFAVYGASVMSDDGQAAIFWGKVKQPLKNLSKNVELSIVPDGDKRFLMDFYAVIDGTDVSFQLPLVLSSKLETKPEHADLRTALRKGDLGKYLCPMFVKPKKLSEIAPGTYQVTGYTIRYFNGDPKVTITVTGVGEVNANTYLKNKLLANPTITFDEPATIEVGVSTRFTSTGHPIVPITLVTKADEDIPVFDFTDPDITEKSKDLVELEF